MRTPRRLSPVGNRKQTENQPNARLQTGKPKLCIGLPWCATGLMFQRANILDGFFAFEGRWQTAGASLYRPVICAKWRCRMFLNVVRIA